MKTALIKAIVVAAVFFGLWLGLEYLFSTFIAHQPFNPSWGMAVAAGLIFGGIVLLKVRTFR